MSIRAAIDTNIIASAIVARRPSPPLRIYQAILTGEVVWVTADQLVAELEEVLSRPKLAKLHHRSVGQIGRLVAVLAQLSMVIPIESVSPITDDPDDDFLLAAAFAGQADYIVSGDGHPLGIKVYQGIQVLRPAKFVELLALD